MELGRNSVNARKESEKLRQNSVLPEAVSVKPSKTRYTPANRSRRLGKTRY